MTSKRGHSIVLGASTRRVLALLRARWAEAAAAETASVEVDAWARSLDAIDRALRTDATVADVEAVIPLAPVYPTWSRSTLRELAAAAHEGRDVLVEEREDGAIRWTVTPIDARKKVKR